jgi:lipoprotein-anchoring transpeptidase ErfK/SrfK
MVLAVGAIGLAAPATAAPAQAAGAAAFAGGESHELAVLQELTPALTAPDWRSRPLENVLARRPISGHTTVLPVSAHATDDFGKGWLKVLLPGRPNSHSGWIPSAATAPSTTAWQITVDLSARRVTASRNGHPVRRFRAVVGAPSTPTPVGSFFVEEIVRLGRHAPGAPIALALSARSTVLRQFEGGPGQIAFHGTRNVGGVLGTAASHGCMRLRTSAINWLAKRVGPGSPVSIQR